MFSRKEDKIGSREKEGEKNTRIQETGEQCCANSGVFLYLQTQTIKDEFSDMCMQALK